MYSHRAMVVKQSRASYFIKVLGMLEVDVLNPASSCSFLSEKWSNKNNLDFGWEGDPWLESGCQDSKLY